MKLADISIKRPIFITCLVLVMLVVGFFSMRKLGVDLFPDVNFPVVTVSIPYPGAAPQEIETLVSKPVEDEVSTLSGIRRVTSKNLEGVSVVIAEFRLETDIKYAEQQIRDRVSAARKKLPNDVLEPVIRRLDPADQPVLSLAIKANLPPGKLYDLANEVVRPKLEQITGVGVAEVVGGRKREIQVMLDSQKMKNRETPVMAVVQSLASSGVNVPSGKIREGKQETIFRTLGEFRSVAEIKSSVVNLYGNEVPTTISDIGTVVDGLVDETSRVYVNGESSLFVNVYRQSGANTIAVVESVKKQLDQVSKEIQSFGGEPKLEIVRDGSKWIRDNVDDVKEAIIIGIILTIVVVYFFLANGRSTIITGLALPNSLLGAFILMTMAGFTINIVTLLALSLAVGLLIDDAIVVRENIFRHIERGSSPIKAAKEGTAEVGLAVIATTMVVIAVFGPVAFMKGFTGQFFRQFGLTVCFAMAISLFDALTIAPMLSAYFAGKAHKKGRSQKGIWNSTVGRLVVGFEHFQNWLENKYEHLLAITVKRPLMVLGISFAIFAVSIGTVSRVPFTFMPPQDAGEFQVALDLPPGTNLETMDEVAKRADASVREMKEVAVSALTVGGRNGEPNQANFYVRLVPAKQRKINTSQAKEEVRKRMTAFADANPKVKDYDPIGSGDFRPFMLRIMSDNQEELEDAAARVLAYMKTENGLLDVDTSFRPGKPEVQIALSPARAKAFGITAKGFGEELRGKVEGFTPAKFREAGREYDIRVRLVDGERNLRDNFNKIFIPNVNYRLVKLSDVATLNATRGPATIDRQDRGRYIQISADIRPGAGLGDVIKRFEDALKTTLKLPPTVRYAYIGDSENFQEFAQAMALAMGFSVLFIFLVLASLYESFITPFTIMLALPLAVCGAFFALFVSGQSVNLFSMIGVIMLLGVASKNSILLVDYANQLIAEGVDRSTAIVRAGKVRLRPILMTTMALIAGTLPVAMGLSEASRQRTSMGIAIIGGLISSTLLTLVVVPAAFSYVDRFRLWSKAKLSKSFGSEAAVTATDV